jgi:hypothetical protein
MDIDTEIKDVASVAAVAHYADLHRQGRTKNQNIFSGIPIDDPAYISGNISGMVALHYLVWPVLGICLIPVLFGGLIAVGVGYSLITVILEAIIGKSIVLEAIMGGIALGVYLYYIVWRVACKKVIGGLVRNLF